MRVFVLLGLALGGYSQAKHLAKRKIQKARRIEPRETMSTIEMDMPRAWTSKWSASPLPFSTRKEERGTAPGLYTQLLTQTCQGGWMNHKKAGKRRIVTGEVDN